MAMMLLASSSFATTIYCKMDKSWWKADGAAVAVHHWGGETAATTWPGVRMTPVEGDADVWSYDVPADVTGLIFVRVNGSGDIADWGAKTADLTIPTDGKNLYTITSENPVWGNPGVTGVWSTYTPGETPEPTPKQYYAKYAPNWEYKLMTEAAGMWLTDTIVYKGIGININDVAEGDGLFYSNEEIEGARAIAGAAIATNDTIYFSFNPADSVLTAVMVGQYVEPVAPVAHYYLAGTMNNWTIGATEFVAGNEDTLSVSVALAADSVYEFKIVKVLDTDTVWFGNMEAATMVYGNSTGWWLNGEANVGLQTTSAADYLFIFKANENNEISVVIPEPAPAPKQYYAKYAPNWEYKLMTEAAGMWLTDTIVYKGIGININDVAEGDGLFYSNEEIEGARAIAGAAIATNDTIYFSFNPADSVLTAVMVGQYVEPVAPVAHYYLAGTMNNWTIGATEFVAGNEDTLSVSVALAADSVYEFKIVKVLDTDTVWFGNMEAATMVYGNSTGWWLNGEANVGLQTTSAADYLFIFKANENNEISVVIPEPETPQPQLENGYYLVGKFGGVDAWSVADLSAEKRFAQNPENESEYMLAINLDVNDEIKVVYVENDAIQTWFPAEGGNYVIDDHHNGATTMFFRPDCQGGEGWFAGCIYVVPTSTVGVENTNAAIEAVKVVRNGQILIIRGEHSYTVMGQMIK